MLPSPLAKRSAMGKASLTERARHFPRRTQGILYFAAPERIDGRSCGARMSRAHQPTSQRIRQAGVAVGSERVQEFRQADHFPNHLRKVVLSLRNAGSRHRSMFTFSASSRYREEERGLRATRRAFSIAPFGSAGLPIWSKAVPSFTNQGRNAGDRPCQPRTRSTHGESAQTQISNSGAITMAADRSFHPDTSNHRIPELTRDNKEELSHASSPRPFPRRPRRGRGGI
jgi:hypothetical protein